MLQVGLCSGSWKGQPGGVDVQVPFWAWGDDWLGFDFSISGASCTEEVPSCKAHSLTAAEKGPLLLPPWSVYSFL